MKEKLILFAIALFIISSFYLAVNKSSEMRATKDGSGVLNIPFTIKTNLPLAMAVTFPGPVQKWSAEVINKTYLAVRKLGIPYSVMSYSWLDLEERIGKYTFKDLDYFIKNMAPYKIKSALIIKIIDNKDLGEIPNDLLFNDFSDTDYIVNLNSLLNGLLSKYENEISYLFIGNEIDAYLYQNKDKVESFKKMLRAVNANIKAKYPNIKTGTIFSYSDLLANDSFDLVKDVGTMVDVVGFSYYPQLIHGEKWKDSFDKDFYQMDKVSKQLNKKMVFTEIGVSSSGFNSTERDQAFFVEKLIENIKMYKEDIGFAGIFCLYDLPRNFSMKIVINRNRQDSADFVDMQESLGLLRNNGVKKLALQSFINHIRK